MHFRGAALAFSTVLTVLKAGVIAGIVTFCVSDYIANATLPEDFVLPQIKLSPYEIFANQVPLFDVDFFNPMDDQSRTVVTTPSKTEEKEITLNYEEVTEDKKEYAKFNFADHDFKVDITNAKEATTAYEAALSDSKTDLIGKAVLEYFKDNGENIGNKSINGEYAALYQIKTTTDTYKIKQYASGTGSAIKTTYAYYKTVTTDAETEEVVLESTAKQLQSTISTWYLILRNVALVALLSVLVYVGIRIIISSSAGDKAKYKQWLIDWIVAICLLFTMHYIMSFSNIFVKKLTNLVDATDIIENGDTLPDGVSGTADSNGVSTSKAPQVFTIDDDTKVKKAKEVLESGDNSSEFSGLFVEENGKTVLKWPTNNFMEQARMLLQYQDSDDNVTNYAYASIGYKIIYIVLVLYTFIFAFTYLKRVVYMSFLTLIAPLVALTYPIDKMNDGQAQAFNKWFKEYIFNLLIQPLHLILYMVLIGSAFDFASKNLFYVVIALGFMTQGEKLLRQFFGFEKAHTPGFLGGPAGAAIMMGGVNKLLGKTPLGGKTSKEIGGSSSESSSDDGKINVKDDLDTSTIYGGKASGMVNNILNGVNGTNGNSTVTSSGNTVINGLNGGTLSGGGVNVTGRGAGNTVLNAGNVNLAGGNNLNIPNSGVSNNDKKKLKLGKGVQEVFARHGEKIVLKSKNSKPLRSLARGVAGAAGAATAMTAAGLVGITSGDPSKAAQYMTGAALGGYKFAKGFGDKAADIGENIKEDTDTFKQAALPEEDVKEEQIQENIKESRNNMKLQRELAKRTGGMTEAKEAMDEVGDACVRYGLSDARDIATAYELNKNGYGTEDAIKTVKAVKDYGKNTSKLGHKDREDFKKTIEDRVRKQMPSNAKEKEVKDTVDGLIKQFDNTSKIYYKD